MTVRIDVHIERLVLRGVPSSSSRRFAMTLTAALERELADRSAGHVLSNDRALPRTRTHDDATTSLAKSTARTVAERVWTVSR